MVEVVEGKIFFFFSTGTARGAAAAGVPPHGLQQQPALLLGTQSSGVFWTQGLQYGGLWHETHARIGSCARRSLPAC